jgi:hypothetical protein
MIYRIIDNSPVPVSIAQLRADYPSISFPSDPNDDQLASYASLNPPLIIVRPVPTEPPPHDPNSQWVQESLPAWSDGAWRQAWTVHDLPPPEPVSDWAGFGAWLGDEPAAAEAIATARLSVSPQGEPATSWYLPQAIMTARLGNITEFAMAWTRFRQASHMSPEVLAAIVAKAAEFNLPAEFIAALQPQSPPG